jgi:trans-aconitate methyltransferase
MNDTDDLIDLYAAHPLTAETIKQRLVRDGVENPTERDLAIDPHGEVTDQNHPGGMAATLQLAGLGRIESADNVIDLGCGLGGAMRLLVSELGCRAHGIELTPARAAGAVELTELVGLSDLVTFEAGDVLTAPVEWDSATVLWGQGAWVHLSRADRLDMLRKWRPALHRGGRVVMEEPATWWEPGNRYETLLVRAVAESWRAHLHSFEQWRDLFTAAGMTVDVMEHGTDLGAYYRRLLMLDDADPLGSNRFPQERLMWQRAVDAANRSLVTTVRIVAHV